ncbi:hypothetical protein CKF54_04500 [Psittacicella hinzii]|uniref:Ion-translocating oxidoreductase complex subunit C n=1 Tax=Psittacicella hinzii TaxID=2028575 RepID=A0A3A1Y577_9GAMM|nr:4Fe-4S dicluster domain-containing protein [Psittacicella hinzii]RIY32611.1 hypothetical protein CKF54_04500 [Psittacicella hinzii]
MILNQLKSFFSVTAQKLTKKDISAKLHRRIYREKLYHFHGGLHLELGKHLTNKAPVYQFENLNYYLLNMQQHKGPKPISLVEEGDVVKAGQMLTSNYIPGELPIHSPVDGKILAITEYLQASEINKTGQTIVVANQTQEQLAVKQISSFEQGTAIGPQFYTPLNYFEAPRLDILWRIKNAGISGLGGAVFPSARKINNRYFKTLLINAAECEPYITCDDALMQNYATDIIRAICCMQYVLQTSQVVIAIEDDKPQAIANLKQAIANKQQALRQMLEQVGFDFSLLAKAADENHIQELKQTYSENLVHAAAKLYALNSIKVRVIPTRYPSGNQRTTIEVLTGLRLTKKQNLTSLGAICFNIGTVYSMYRAIAFGEVLTQRLVTITGTGIKKPGNYWIPFGATPALILDTLGINEGFTNRVIMGGPMMGFTIDDLNTPINKATNCLIFVGQEDIQADQKLFAPEEEQACIRCTACQEVCPMLLQPQQLYWYEKDKDDTKLTKANLSSCIECGLCDYVCPSSIPLVSYFQQAKFRIWNERKKIELAEESKARFEVKSEREKIAKAERDAKRQADKQRNLERAQQMRQKAMAESGIDPIAAAKERLKAKGIATGQATEISAGNDLPDNSSIMEQRRLRRLQKQQEQEQAQTGSTSAEKTVTPNAVQEAVRRAKERQAAAIANKQQATQSTSQDSKQEPMNAVQKAVALAKAKQAAMAQQASEQEAQTSNEKPLVPSAVQEAVRRAKERQAAALAAKQQEQAQTNVASQEPMNAVQRAVALAKAKQAAAMAQQATEQEAQTSNEKPLVPSAVQEAVRRAKERQAAALAAKQQEQAQANTASQEPMNAVQRAVALAKAKQEAALAQQAQAKEQELTSTSSTPKEVKPVTEDNLENLTPVQRAVALAKARQAQAKAEQANAQEQVKEPKVTQEPEVVNKPTAEETPNLENLTPVQRAVALAKARQAQAKAEQAKAEQVNAQEQVKEPKVTQEPEVPNKPTAEETPNLENLTPVQRAVALAKARQAQAKAEQANTQEQVAESKVAKEPEVVNKPTAEEAPNLENLTPVQRAVALAKARQAQAKREQDNAQEQVKEPKAAKESEAINNPTAEETPNLENLTPVQRAVALAKARQAQARAQQLQNLEDEKTNEQNQ